MTKVRVALTGRTTGARIGALGLMLAAGSAFAGATVNFDDENSPLMGTSIENLDVNGTLYKVVFTGRRYGASCTMTRNG